MPTSSTKATQGSAKSNGPLYNISVQATSEAQQFVMSSFLNEPYAPVSSRLQNPSYAPGSYVQDSARLRDTIGPIRPHPGTLAGIGSQFTDFGYDDSRATNSR